MTPTKQYDIKPIDQSNHGPLHVEMYADSILLMGSSLGKLDSSRIIVISYDQLRQLFDTVINNKRTENTFNCEDSGVEHW